MLNLKGMRENELLAPHTTFGMGGIARHFIEVTTPEEFVEAGISAQKADLRYQIIAGGSNLVISDGHFDGVVIKVAGGEISHPLSLPLGHGEKTVVVDAGVPLMSLITYAIERSLGGLETLSGIPGTVGGAIVGNAAAYGQGIGERVVAVEVFDPQKNIRSMFSNDECTFGYRDSFFKHEGSHLIVLRATFAFDQGDCMELQKKSEEIIATRTKKYPPGLRTPGSFFKNLKAENLPSEVLVNIPNLHDFYGKVPAWYFLNEVGARGTKHGGLRIADFHGNYIINEGEATYAQVRELAEELKKRVREKFGVELEEEIRYIETK